MNGHNWYNSWSFTECNAQERAKEKTTRQTSVGSGSAALFSSSTHGLSAPLETVVPALAWLKNLGRSMERTKRRVWTATKPRRQHGQDRSEDRGGPSNGKNYGKTGAKMAVLQIRLWENRIICSYKRGWRTMLKHVVLCRHHSKGVPSHRHGAFLPPLGLQTYTYISISYVDISLHRHYIIIYIHTFLSMSFSISLSLFYSRSIYISIYMSIAI